MIHEDSVSSQLRNRLVKKKRKGAITALTVTQNLTFKYPRLDKHSRSHFMEDSLFHLFQEKKKTP